MRRGRQYLRESVGVLLCIVACAGVIVLQENLVQGEPQMLSPAKTVDGVSFPSDEGKTGAIRIYSSIVVDQDDNICELSWSEKSDHSLSGKEIVQYLGRRVSSSGNLDLAELLPKGKVPSNEARVTLNNSTYHLIIASGFDKRTRVPTISYSLYAYVTQQGRPGARLIYSEENIADALEQFVVRDLSGDGTAEIIDVGRTGSASVATLRQLDQQGVVKKLQELSADEQIDLHLDSPQLGAYVSLTDHVRVNRPTKPPKVGERIVTLYWSPIDKRFVPRGEATYHPN